MDDDEAASCKGVQAVCEHGHRGVYVLDIQGLNVLNSIV